MRQQYNKEHFVELERLNNDLTKRLMVHSECDSIIEDWERGLDTHKRRINEIQYTGKANTRFSTPDIKKMVLAMHLQAIRDALNKKATSSSQAHALEVFFRYERLCDLVDHVGTNAIILGLDRIDRQTLKIINFYRNYALRISNRYNYRFEHQTHFSNKQVSQNLEQNALVGLLMAARQFNHHNDVQFMTHLFYCIQSQNFRDDEQSCVVSMQEKDKTIYRKIEKILKDYNQRGAPPPTDAELATLLGISVIKIKGLLNYPTMLEVKKAPSEEEGPACSMDIFADTKETNIFDQTHLTQLSKHIAQALEALRPIEQRVIKHYFNLDDNVNVDDLTKDQLYRHKNMALKKIRLYMYKNDIGVQDVFGEKTL